jgi:maleylacetoacetate isomerase
MSDFTLYGYWRSSASYRVRIALALKGLEAAFHSVHLIKSGGEQHGEAFLRVNPHGLVPALVHHLPGGDVTISNSLAIIEYLDEISSQVPLLPADPAGRARVRQISQAIASDIHPLQNLRVLQMAAKIGGEEAPISMSWAKHWINVGFKALEEQLSDEAETGRFCHGDSVSLADLCLIPQIANSARYGVDLTAFPTLSKINDQALALEAFKAAAPENQPDAET